jgi:DNA-binding transcriptional LysR family regulator
MERHPLLRPHVTSGSALVDLVAGDADIAVRFGAGGAEAPVPPTQESDLHARLLTPVACHVFASRTYLQNHSQEGPVAPERLKFIAPTQGMPGADWVNENIRQDNVVIQSDYYGGTLEMVVAGLGAAILPDFVAARGCELQCLSHLGVIARRSLWVIWPTDLRRVARVQAVVDFITECVQKSPCVFDLGRSSEENFA